jgi:hypothetical protein
MVHYKAGILTSKGTALSSAVGLSKVKNNPGGKPEIVLRRFRA